MKKLFSIYKQNAQLIFVVFGIKCKFKYPAINYLEDICLIPNLRELLDKGTKFPHPIGIVINGACEIGNNCTIFQNVTIGDGFSSKTKSHYPKIGNDVTIFANSVVVGGITVGDNATIGAGSVVIHDVPSNAVAVGNPAKIIKYKNI